MRLLYLTRDYPPAIGGMERNAAEMTAALARVGHSVRVLAPHGAHAMPGTEFHSYRLHRNWRLAGARLRLTMVSHAFSFRPDAIIANTWSPCGWAARAAARLANVPLFIVAHGLDVREPLQKPSVAQFELATLRRCSAVLAVSRYTKEHLVRAGLSPDHIRVVPNGVDSERFQPELPGHTAWRAALGLPDGPLFLTVARLVPHKGHAAVLAALAALVARGTGCSCCLVGDGPEYPALAAQAQALGIADRVRFIRNLPESELPLAYAAADVMVMPSVPAPDGSVEGFGIAYLEGSAAGVPVIGCSGTGAEDAIVNEETGFLVPPGDQAALAARLALLADQPALSRQLGAAGRARAIAEFNWDALARKLSGIIESAR
ncbi:MAG TPA: glycosyltransferase family 4 protein [bacterium]|nr:glycosyltransferase family 4 protein [bacterium]